MNIHSLKGQNFKVRKRNSHNGSSYAKKMPETGMKYKMHQNNNDMYKENNNNKENVWLHDISFHL